MSWLNMSIPTLPGGVRKPNPRHPGAGNLEWEKKKETPEQAEPDDPASKPEEQRPGTPNSSQKTPRSPEEKS